MFIVIHLKKESAFMPECGLYNNVLPHSLAGDFEGDSPAANEMAADRIAFKDLKQLMENEGFANAVNNAVYGLGISGVVYNGKKDLVYDISIAGLQVQAEKLNRIKEIKANDLKKFASLMQDSELTDIVFADPFMDITSDITPNFIANQEVMQLAA